ncbi:malate dehydrogenase [Streptomyces sp. TR06-5]|uniref:malate dehydrogenase n=1 Tax=unclassified Streptomyces TaxID=2593676 RepID=UPI0039A08AE8
MGFARPRAKVGVVGAGHLGAAVANALVLRETCRRLVLYDRTLAKVEGEGWDIADAVPHLREQEVDVTDDLGDLAGCAVVVLAAGPTVTAGQSRLDLCARNAPIVRSLVSALDEAAPEAVLLLVSNPVDLLTRIAQNCTRRDPAAVIGSGTVNDTARLKYALAGRLGVDHRNVHAYMVGEHGDSSFCVWSAAHVGGVALADFPRASGIDIDTMKRELVAFTHDRGREIHRRKGYTNYGAAAAAVSIVECVLRDERRILSVSGRVPAAYGLPDGTVLSLPCVVGASGVDRHLVLALEAGERALLEEAQERLQDAYEPGGAAQRPPG